MRKEILKTLENQEFVERIVKMVNEEQVQEAFNEIGVSITDDEIMELAKYLGRIYEKIKNIPLEELENYVGGNILQRATTGYLNYTKEGIADPINNAIFGNEPYIPNDEHILKRGGRKVVEVSSYAFPIAIVVPVAKFAAKQAISVMTSWFTKNNGKKDK